MNYLFKIMIVILTLGILFLQGCQTSDIHQNFSMSDIVKKLENDELCNKATTNNGSWDLSKLYTHHLNEAKRRGLDCGIKDKKTIAASKKKQKSDIDVQTIACALMPSGHCRFLKKSNEELCENIIGYKRGIATYDNYSGSFNEAKRRGFTCEDESKNKAITASKPKTQTYTKPIISSTKLDLERKKRVEQERKLAEMEAKLKQEIGKNNFECFFAFANKTRCKLKRVSSINLCTFLRHSNNTKIKYKKRYQEILKEVKFRKLNCGTRNNKNRIVVAQTKKKKVSKSYSSKPNISKNNNQELLKKIELLEAKLKQVQQMIDTDVSEPLLEILSNNTKGKRGTITGIARDNVEVAEVTIDGKAIQLSVNGSFKYSTFVPSDGITLIIQVTDLAGLTSSKTVSLQRNSSTVSTSISFDRLNPLNKKVKGNANALALIVGVEGYENTNADALYADRDAKMFKDYASEKLGIPENRIKILLNDKAEYGEILLTTKDWLRRASKTNKSDIFIFFAGHGLASDDGKNMYLLPYDVRPRLLDKTALLRDELFRDIQQSNPRNVTVFLDTCYSGTTRGTDMLIASRPIIIKAKEQSIPENFTVFSAAAGDQTSKPLKEAKHGMFSYFLMKGMEGDADANADNKITAQELHDYVKENVTQQSSGSQTPELQGDKERVLVQFN